MDYHIKKGLTLIGILTLSAGLNWLFPKHWWYILLGLYFILFIYVVIKKWNTWYMMGGMINEMIKKKLEVTEVKKDESK